ncbi:TIGR03621 family F420-dependent LLM class oxidoreductase [Rhabdothermincola salaria]|uniref:TIGR03621 family F420-dependent LLM class oxidoreductase n=1 Tax=Rhabdothermincola salaria TaxID=2903142 RepID=UPI0024B4CBCC|nr:TIGR03621 family F420-dependent LLM class oxidoreductase [Rhabdothermincola salaria]
MSAVPLPRPKPFRFGVQASAPAGGLTGTPADARAWRDLARRVEDLGYATLTVADHFDDQFAITPAVMAAADATTRLRVGGLVWCNDYRHPVVMAKEAATIDVLCEGRFELGLGAGWMTTDYEQSGIALDRPGVRIERLAEAVGIIKGLFADGPVSFDGDHYRVHALEGLPKPLQRPGPPLLLGGGGRRMLSLAAREADIVGINIDLRKGVIDADAGPNATTDATTEKLRWIHDAAGDRYDDLELQVRVHVAAVTDDRDAMAELLGPALGISPADALESPHALAGTVEQLVEQIQERRDRFGISYIGIGADAMEGMAPVVARLAGT